MQAGHPAGFAVWVWSADGAGTAVTVTAKVAAAKNIGAAKFTVCPHASQATCALGTVPANQADELRVASAVGPAATAREQVKLTVTVAGKNTLSDKATAALSVTASGAARGKGSGGKGSGKAGGNGSGGAGGSGGLLVPLPPVLLPPLAQPPGVVGNPAGLFPTVAPVPGSSSPAIGFPSARMQPGQAQADTASAIVPLDPKLFGAQLAGLAVLAAAVAIAIARLSLRRRLRDRPREDPTAKS